MQWAIIVANRAEGRFAHTGAPRVCTRGRKAEEKRPAALEPLCDIVRREGWVGSWGGGWENWRRLTAKHGACADAREHLFPVGCGCVQGFPALSIPSKEARTITQA